VQSSLELPAGHYLERVAEVNDERVGVVLDVLPVAVPVRAYLRRRARNAEQHGCCTVIRVAHHAHASHARLGLRVQRVEQCVPEIAVVARPPWLWTLSHR
jgi:hypothetical protein